MTSTELERATPGTNGATGQAAPGPRVFFTPRVDIVETEAELFLYADLPGVHPDDVSLDRRGNDLILHARCRPRRHGARAVHAEYGVGDFYRAFAIAEQVDADGIEASLENGVLTVRVPKAEAIRPKRISVKGG